jgi:hypothetical protein
VIFHFAYPNVLPRQERFIGCGRYAVFAADDVPAAGYSEVLSAPNTPNKNILKRVVQLLAPESYDSGSRLFQKQDQQEQTYQGDSLDLAWLLAHVLRGRNLQLKSKTDIWCTGVVQLDGSGPHLLDVHPAGFHLKLQAFLDAANQDLLFIVPLANMEPDLRRACEAGQVQVTRLDSFESCNPGRITGKTVLTVAADELAPLLDLLFAAPLAQAGGGNRKRILLAVILLLTAGTAALGLLSGKLFREPGQQSVQPKVSQPLQPLPAPEQPEKQPAVAVPPALQVIEEQPVSLPTELKAPPLPIPRFKAGELTAEIHHGDFTRLPALLATDEAEDTEELERLRQQAGYVLSFDGELQYRLASGVRSSVPLQKNTNPPVLNANDLYRCRFNAELPPDELYLYLLQVDSGGSMTALFPNPEFAGENPVRIGQWPLTVPGNDQWLFLDQLSGKSGSRQQAIETLYLVASPWPAEDIEALIGQTESQAGSDSEQLSSRLAACLARRQQAELPAVITLRWSFIHGQ